MNSTCPSCGTTYRLDPKKIPETGVRARCVRCDGIFGVTREQGNGVSAPPAESPVPTNVPSPAETVEAPIAAPTPLFGVADPAAKARRLARALISDIVVYHPERRERAMEGGTLRQEFREEIKKSWEEYVSQVGDSTARGTPYFREALNEILAGGERMF